MLDVGRSTFIFVRAISNLKDTAIVLVTTKERASPEAVGRQHVPCHDTYVPNDVAAEGYAAVTTNRVVAAWEDERDGPAQIYVARAAPTRVG